MATIELACLGILAFVALMRARSPGSAEWLRDAPLVGLAALIAEDTTIRLYGFYEYAPGWHVFVDRVPILIPTIWIFVVLSARDVVRHLTGRGVLLGTFLMVWYDASFIEPVATTSRLWTWTVPGPFGVPLIGTLGWALFAASAMLCLGKLRGPWRLLTLVIAPAMTHVLLLAAWWGLLRWLPRGSDVPAAVVAVVLSAALVALAVVFRKARTAPLSLMAPRMPPALFFIALLALNPVSPALVVYAVSFAVPWLAMVRWTWSAETAPRLSA